MSFDRECLDKCRSVKHGDTVCATLTKRQALDAELCAYLQQLCCSCESVKDPLGRTALHVAASCGRAEIVKWLLNNKHANINAKDTESGYTPLHRSIFYGKIDVAVNLIKLGANIALTDYNGLTSLEHAIMDNIKSTQFNRMDQGEVYVWGSNTNYTLGPQQARLLPELLDAYHKEYPNLYIKQIYLEKFHCILLSSDGQLFACGHGQGGRLGLPTQKTVLHPKQIKLAANGHSNPVICKKASIALDHSVFLSESGHVWTCGLNTHKVLGLQPPPAEVLTPSPLGLTQYPVQDVCAARYHTVAWGPKAIYTWGLHGGQLGHDKSNHKYMVTPKLVTCLFGMEHQIIGVAASTGATAVVTSKGDIYVLHEYQCRKIVSRHPNIISICIIGGKLNDKIDSSISNQENHELKVIGLSIVGNIYIWQETYQQLARCIFSINRSLTISQVVLNLNEILFVTNNGEAFQAILKPRKRKLTETNINNTPKSAFHEFLEKDNCQLLKVTKIPRIYRAISIHSDLKGRNYAVVQFSPKAFLSDVPHRKLTHISTDMNSLLYEARINDAIHDCAFKTSKQIFPAHQYIVALNSNKLSDIITMSIDKTVDLSEIHSEIFEQLLLYMYTKSCELIKPGKCPARLQNIPNLQKNSTKDPIRLLQEISKRFGVGSLQKRLEKFYYVDGFITTKNITVENIKLKFDPAALPQLQDIVVKTKDNKAVPVHKCVLAARLEYFNNLLSVRWNESSSSKEVFLPFPSNIVSYIIEFLYTEEVTSLHNDDLDQICHLLIAADQLMILGLKELCESVLYSFIQLKNVVLMLSFSILYNANELKKYCMEFICLNLAAILESKALELLDDQILSELTNFYYRYNPIMQSRVITPYSYAPSDEEVAAAANLIQISFDDNDVDNKTNVKAQKKRTRSRKYSTKKDEDSTENANSLETILMEREEEMDEVNEPKIISSPANSKVEARLRAIMSAQNIVKNDEISFECTSLPLGSPIDFPVLNSHSNTGICSKSPGKADKFDFKQKISKLSQKQRKRLSSESSNPPETPTLSISESPKNPWKVLNDTPSNSIESSDVSITIDSIIIDEKKQKENFVKMKTKSLIHTQMEDKAIEDLYKFYNVDNVFDEIVTVNRVQMGLVASPVWVHLNRTK